MPGKLHFADIYENQPGQHQNKSELAQGIIRNFYDFFHHLFHIFREPEVGEPFDYHHHANHTQKKLHFYVNLLIIKHRLIPVKKTNHYIFDQLNLSK